MHFDRNKRIRADELMTLLPPHQIEKCFSDPTCTLDAEFMGYTDYYRALSELILSPIIIDFGCGWAPQCYYFRDRTQYLGIDLTVNPEYRFHMKNSKHYYMAIRDFIENEFPTLGLNKEDCFAICNYVEDSEARNLIRETFPKCFVYYPD